MHPSPVTSDDTINSDMEAFAVFALVAVMAIVPWMMAGSPSSRFTSQTERRLWGWVLVVLAAIYATLVPAPVLAEALRERDLLRISGVTLLVTVSLVLGVLLVRRRPGQREIGVALGIVVVYVMALIRMGSWEERTHLFEYGLVGILIYHALRERMRNGRGVRAPAIFAVLATALLGWLDEGIQALLPNRVYDLRDVGFNALAGLMAVTSTAVLLRARRGKVQKTES